VTISQLLLLYPDISCHFNKKNSPQSLLNYGVATTLGKLNTTTTLSNDDTHRSIPDHKGFHAYHFEDNTSPTPNTESPIFSQ
jgi:hypothetical protein